MWLKSLIACIALGACTVATTPPASGLRTSADFPKPRPGERIVLNAPRAVDGDTLRADDLEIRIFGADTPEIFSSSRCDEEKAAGLAARDFVQSRLDAANTVVAEVSSETDRYGRTLAKIEADGVDLGAALLTARHALPYSPGGYDWCPDPTKAQPRKR